MVEAERRPPDQARDRRHPGGVQHPVFGLAPLQGANHSSFLSGGLRFAATTGYYLAALQAGLLEVQLNQFGGNFEQAEMVKAFIVSGEYRARFAQ